MLASFVFSCNFGVDDQFLGMIVQRLSRVLEFTAVNLFSADKFPDLYDELAGPFEPRFFAFCVSEIRLMCTCEGCRNET